MADTNTTYQKHISDIVNWIQITAASMVQTSVTQPDPTQRTWCLLDLTAIDPATISDYFDNTTVNQQYQAEYDQVTESHQLTNNPVAYMQYESDMLFALQKSFIQRHTSRMQCYRDDCEQKDIRLHNLLHYSSAKFEDMKKTA